MPGLHELRDKLLQDGRITDDEVRVIRDHIDRDGQLDMEDVKFLVGLLSEAVEVCPAFDELFFPVLKEVILADGKVDLSEQFCLLKMLYSDGHIRDNEKRFLAELCDEAHELTPEMLALCEEAFGAHPTEWSLGGK